MLILIEATKQKQHLILYMHYISYLASKYLIATSFSSFPIYIFYSNPSRIKYYTQAGKYLPLVTFFAFNQCYELYVHTKQERGQLHLLLAEG